MKIYELYNSLTQEEKKSSKKFFVHPNEQLNKLFGEITNLPEENFVKSKPAIYRKIYGKPWTDKQDKYFKNQLSALYDHFRSHVSQEWMAQKEELVELVKISNYLYELMRRVKEDLFEKEWNYYYQQFEEMNYYLGLSELCRLKYGQLIRNIRNVDEATRLLKEAYRYKIMAYQEEEAILKYTAFTLNYSKDIYALDKTFRDDDFRELREEVEATFFNPISLANNLIIETNEDRKWKLVQDIFEFLSDAQYKLREANRFKVCQSIFNYSIVLMYDEQIEKAEAIMNFILVKNLINSTVISPSVFYFNYSTLLLKKGDTENSYLYHKMVMERLEEVPESRRALFLIRNIYLNILNSSLSSVYDDICSVTPSLYKEDQILYVRVLLVIYLVESGDLESAKRECENAKKTTSYNVEIAEEESTILDFILKLIGIQTKEKIDSTKYQVIRESIFSSEFWKKSTHLLKIWLNRYIEQLDRKF